MKITQPVIIVGSGRCGSTEFFNLLSRHANLAWLSYVCNTHPEKPFYNRSLLRAIDLPFIGKLLLKKFKPEECYPFWDDLYRGFSNPCRDLFPEDVTILCKQRIPQVLSAMLTSKRNRILLKITGWPRIGFLREIFPDAKFIHIIRDGRAVANSLINVDFWWGWRGPKQWRWGEPSEQHVAEWTKHNYSFVALAGIEWKLLMDAMEHAKSYIDPKNFLQIKYETLCADPLSVMKEVSEFAELSWNQAFVKEVRNNKLRSANDKWIKELTDEQKQILEEVLSDYLKFYGYTDSPKVLLKARP